MPPGLDGLRRHGPAKRFENRIPGADVNPYLALAAMIARTAKSQAKFPPGTSQHTLQRNRLKALRIAEAALQAARD